MTDPDPTQTPPPDAALPVRTAMECLLANLRCSPFDRDAEWASDLSAHLEEHAALTARVRELDVKFDGDAPPPDVDVAASLAALLSKMRRSPFASDAAWAAVLGAHLKEHAALTAQNASLRSEQAALVAERAAMRGGSTSARREALEWVCSQAMCADWTDLGERIKAELARLKSAARRAGL